LHRDTGDAYHQPPPPVAIRQRLTSRQQPRAFSFPPWLEASGWEGGKAKPHCFKFVIIWLINFRFLSDSK